MNALNNIQITTSFADDEPTIRVLNTANGDVLDMIVQWQDGSGVQNQEAGLMLSDLNDPGMPMFSKVSRFAENAGVAEEAVWQAVSDVAEQYADDLRSRVEATCHSARR